MKKQTDSAFGRAARTMDSNGQYGFSINTDLCLCWFNVLSTGSPNSSVRTFRTLPNPSTAAAFPPACVSRYGSATPVLAGLYFDNRDMLHDNLLYAIELQ